MEYRTLVINGTNGTRQAEVKLSTEDYEWLSQWSWQLSKVGGYARRTVRNKKGGWATIYMHRLIVGLDDSNSIEVDHINGDPLDNRRCNLRPSNRSDNLLNKLKPSSKSTTNFVGVEKHRDKYVARIKLNNKRTYLGTYKTAQKASDVYQKYKIDNVPSYKQAVECCAVNG